jgi:hypothetical protein
MNRRTLSGALLLGLLCAAPVWAANDDLETQEPAYLGEQVASYLQTLLTGVSQTLAVKPFPDVPALNKEPYRATVTYDPDEEAVDVSLVGSQDDVAAVRSILDFTKNLLLGFNKKLDYYYGTTLEEEDIEMEYLDVPDNRTILRFEDGFYYLPAPGKTKGKGSGEHLKK